MPNPKFIDLFVPLFKESAMKTVRITRRLACASIQGPKAGKVAGAGKR